jgi:transposase
MRIGEAMAAKMNKYTKEYRQETADYALSSGKSVSQIARDLGLNQATLNRWVIKRREELGKGASHLDSAPEVKELKRRVAELEMENEFLKKASAFFAKNQK